MPRPKTERRLTAVFAADVAGYSALVAKDEPRTLAQFSAHVSELVGPTVSAHGGRLIKTMGDGVLAAFPSVVDALACAIAVQDGMNSRNKETAPEDRLEFRIGLHAADVVIENGDIFGEGVNIASRLEGLADPGGICVSARVHEDARGRLDIGFEDAGEQVLKNMPRPVRVYRVAMSGGKAVGRPDHALPQRPSIAVLPFQNISGDPEQEYFADAITEDIVTALSRWRWFFVIARNSSLIYKGRAVDARRVGRELGVRYLLEGSVRKVGERVRVTAQLLDAATATNIWADRFDRDLVDLLSLQDEITEKVVNAIEPAMLHSENARLAHKSLKDYTALDCFQRGMWRLNKVSLDGYHEALTLFREAIARDPQLSLGHIGLSRILYGGAIYGWSTNPDEDLKRSRLAGQTAISLDPTDAHAYFACSGASLYLGRHHEALETARKTVALNSNFAYGHSRLGQVLIYSGHPGEAIEPIERALRHSPFDPQMGGMLGTLALAYYQSKDYPQAVEQARASIQHDYAFANAILAAGLVRLGRIDEAREVFPAGLPAREARNGPRLANYANAADRNHLLEALAVANPASLDR